MAQLRIVDLNKSYGQNKALQNVTIETNDGELMVILGPSGCGKSTLLRLIAGLEEMDMGEIWIGGKRIDKYPPRKRNVALVFQNYALYPHMTVERNLAFPLKIAGESRKEIKEKVVSTAAMLGLSERLASRPSELSGGQRQRVALGRAIIRQPDLFLLDEPLSNLDADLRLRMRREIVELQKKLGTTTVHVTHDQTEALTMADRMVVMDAGRIRQIGTVDQIYNRPADLFVASFIGTPKINLLDGWLENNVIKPFGAQLVKAPTGYIAKEVTIGLRPEDIVTADSGRYNGTVQNIEYLGDRSIVTIDYLDLKLTLLAEPKKYQKDDPLRFDIRMEKIHLFNRENGVNLLG
jgi:ABC-type sugar transport system ATPase subunit